MELDSAREQRKRQNALGFKKRLRERDEAKEVREFMQQALKVKQRHVASEGPAKQGFKTFLKYQREYSKAIPEYLRSMVGEEDDYNTAMKLPEIKGRVEDNDDNIDESQKQLA